jgi:hypothetical protein
MAYVSANLNLIISLPGGVNKLWYYAAGTDAQTAIRVNGYFSDGFNKGMRVGDVVFAILTSGAGAIFTVNQATAALGIDCNDGLAIAVTDTD